MAEESALAPTDKNVAQSMIGFGKRLEIAVREKKNPVCVGLDPRIGSLPDVIRSAFGDSATDQAAAFEKFCVEILDAVCDLVPIVKPQAAFFEELGPAGCVALERVVRYATQLGLLVVMDAKRGDIGTTAAAYANAYLGSGPVGAPNYSPWGADALTVNPFLGADTLEPFGERCYSTGSGLFVLVKTSNPGSGFVQDIATENGSIAESIAIHVQTETDRYRGSDHFGPIGAVVGATYPEQLAKMRALMPNAWILIPGYGAQGGSAQSVRVGMDEQGLGAIVNNSRGIIFAHQQLRFQASTWTRSVRDATSAMIEDLAV